MEKQGEVNESCITLPMTDDILWMGENSTYLGTSHNGEASRLLESLASIQGYKYIGACRVQEV